jgi:hypothetical protein
MARQFLTGIDLTQNELIRAVFQNLTQDPQGTGKAGQVYYNTADEVLKIYNGTASAWQAVGSVEFIGDAVYDLLDQGTGISLNYDDNANSLTITNTGVISLAGTSNEVIVSASAGNITIGLPDDVLIAGRLSANSASVSGSASFGGDVTITGDLNVEGNLNAINRTEINVEDNTLILNTGVTGTPTVSAGFQIERGDDTNASLIWDENDNKWKVGYLGSEVEISVVGHTHSSTDITDFREAVEDVVGSLFVDSATVNFEYTDNSASAGVLSASVVTASTSYLTTDNGLAVDKSSFESALVSDGFTRKFAQPIGDGTSTSIPVIHNLGTRNVSVQVYAITGGGAYQTVETDVDRTDANTVTIGFGSAPASAAYTVVVLG